ncbi:MAG: SRPBCC family protein [Thermodesulfobacteriota bacterium]
MPSVKIDIDIKAAAEDVFDLITKVEEFGRYSGLIREVRKLSPGVYRWEVEFLGVAARWEAEVSASERPRYFAWRSVSGLYNTGSYTLETGDGETHVTFEMEYRLSGTLMELLTAPVLSHVITRVHKEVLGNVKKELEK